MRARNSCWWLLVLLAGLSLAKDKSKVIFPDYVLRARTVLVVVSPEAGEPLDHPMANSAARDQVERALTDWGRFTLVLDGQESDLVIAVRAGTGRAASPTIKGGPTDNRPAVVQPGEGSIRIGAQQGHPPPLSNPGGVPDTGPRISNEAGRPEDTFEVYRGGIEYPLDSPAVWRYVAKDALKGPNVTAVEQFRKAIAEAEKQQRKP